MNSSEVTAVEKALLVVTLGFLEALRCGAIDDDEAFHTIGIPKIIDRMETYGVASRVADLVSQLDEFAPLRGLVDDAGWRASISEVMDDCKAILAAMPPPGPTRIEPVLRLFLPAASSA
jgi:hypothetical protein